MFLYKNGGTISEGNPSGCELVFLVERYHSDSGPDPDSRQVVTTPEHPSGLNR